MMMMAQVRHVACTRGAQQAVISHQSSRMQRHELPFKRVSDHPACGGGSDVAAGMVKS